MTNQCIEVPRTTTFKTIFSKIGFQKVVSVTKIANTE